MKKQPVQKSTTKSEPAIWHSKPPAYARYTRSQLIEENTKLRESGIYLSSELSQADEELKEYETALENAEKSLRLKEDYVAKLENEIEKYEEETIFGIRILGFPIFSISF